ncbi:MAG TPA: histidine kinase [Bryobacteraceae bacterium]|nr:histidine kinase [Bryobacteraceae bacterium]
MLLVAAAVISEFQHHSWAIPLPIALALCLFMAYSLAALRWKRLQGGSFGLLTLFADTVFLLILANHGAALSLWFPSLLYLLLLAEGVIFYSVREVTIVFGICTVFCLIAPPAHLDVLLRTIVVGGVLAIAFSLYRRFSQAREAELQQEVEVVRLQAEKAAAVALQNVAQDFHDGPLQSYISLQMRLDILRKLLERDYASGMEELRQLQDLALSQVRELRSFIRGLRGPVESDSTTLIVAARRAAESFQKDSGIPVTFVGTDGASDVSLGISPEVASELLQMLREALHNVQKHAGATRVAIGVERVGKVLEISVDDNGHGFRFSGTYNLDELDMLRLGPASIKRRARALNVDLVLESRPGRGAGLKLRVPVP